MPRLPTQDTPYSLGSSARKSTISSACLSTSPRSRKTRAISSPATTPAIPSKRPPEGTVSLCEPMIMVPARGSLPSTRPMRLPAVSIRVVRPASRETSGRAIGARRERAARRSVAYRARGIGDARESHDVGPEPGAVDAEIGARPCPFRPFAVRDPQAIRTTVRPRSLPSRIACPAPMTSASGMVLVIASSFATSRSRARRSQASTRRGFLRHHAVDAEKRDAAQDERRDGGRQIHALRKTAGGDRAAVFGHRQDVRERVRADAVDARDPAFLAQRAALLRELLAIDDLRRAEALEVVRFLDAGRSRR